MGSAQSGGTQAATDAAQPAPEPVYRWIASENGDFEETVREVVGGVETLLPCWWRTSGVGVHVHSPPAKAVGKVPLFGDHDYLALGPSAWVEQPIAAYAPLARELEVRGRVGGSGVLVVIDGTGDAARFELSGDPEQGAEFHVRGEDLERELGHAPTPRFVLRLESQAGKVSTWDDVRCEVALPCPGEDALRAEVVAQLDAIFTTWEERALDDLGPRRTAFVAKAFDVVTGAELAVVSPAPTFFPLQQSLLDACAAQDRPSWRAFLERYLEDLLTLALHPETGLPCQWDPRADVRVDDRPMEVALPLGFLIDVAEQGPERFRERARAAALKIGEVVLAKGLLPDGNVAASYFPRDGAPNLDVSQLRRLDVPCQLARLARLTGDARYVLAVRDALAVFEYTNYWAGTWDSIDPAFDDDYGLYGARAATIARTLPNEHLLGRTALEGLRHFLPLWNDALRLGGNVAADQVRCWRVASDLVRVDPTLRDEVVPTLHKALRAHVRGEQYGNGAWGDVTHYRFDPKATGLQVGDYTGTPQNLLNGLAAVYADHLGPVDVAGQGAPLRLRSEEVRALYTAVLRSSVAEYGRPYGFLLGRGETRGGTDARGSLRVLLGLTTMLRRLAGVEEPL